MTLEEFLEWEERQEGKYEFDGVDVRAMVGVAPAHAAIQANLIASIHLRLRGTNCRVLGSDLKIRVAERIRYPDTLITCSPLPRGIVLDDPVVVFEIVSPSSDRMDRQIKNDEYRQTPSIQTYVILEQDYIGATVYQRNGDDWAGHVFGPGSVLPLPAAGIDLPLDELYEGVPLTA